MQHIVVDTFSYQMAPSHKYWVKQPIPVGLVNEYLYDGVYIERFIIFLCFANQVVGCGAE